ncbi:hypothetical protein D3C87_2145690 [compost metagenome]
MQRKFLLPNRIHDLGSLVAHCKMWGATPSIEDLWMAYLVRLPTDLSKEELHVVQSWFFQEVEEQGYELLLI